MNLKTKIKEELRLLVVDRLVDKYIEEDRSNNIFDLSITRLAAHRNKAFRVWKLLNPVQKENSLEKIYQSIIDHRNDTVKRLPARDNKRPAQ